MCQLKRLSILLLTIALSIVLTVASQFSFAAVLNTLPKEDSSLKSTPPGQSKTVVTRKPPQQNLESTKRWEDLRGKSPFLSFSSVNTNSTEYISSKDDRYYEKRVLSPNRNSNRYSISWQNLSLAVETENQPSADQQLNSGPSSSKDFRLRYYSTNFALEAYYQDYQGFYIEKSVNPATGYPYQYPDMILQHRALSATYVFSPDSFSLSSAYDFGARQTISGGSWLMNSTLGKLQLENKDGFEFDPALKQTEMGKFRKVYLHSLTVGGGGGYNYVYGSFFLSGLMMFNIGSKLGELEDSESKESFNSGLNNWNIKYSVGYNGRSFVTALVYSFIGYDAPLRSFYYSSTSHETAWVFGYRF